MSDERNLRLDHPRHGTAWHAIDRDFTPRLPPSPDEVFAALRWIVGIAAVAGVVCWWAL